MRLFTYMTGLLLMSFASGCNNYGLLEKLKNPGGSSGDSGCFDTGSGIVKAGLVGFWNFNGNFNDKWDCGSGFQTGSANNVTFTTDRFGVAGNAVNLAANTGNVSLGDLAIFNNPPFTVCSWQRNSATGTALSIKKHDGTNGYRIQVRDTAASADLSIQTPFVASVGTGVTVGGWNYVCATFDGTNAILYLGPFNTTMISSSGTGSGYTPAATSLDLTAVGVSFAIDIDDAVFYSRVLNSAEIQRNFSTNEQ